MKRKSIAPKFALILIGIAILIIIGMLQLHSQSVADSYRAMTASSVAATNDGIAISGQGIIIAASWTPTPTTSPN
ncbi:MAG: hypothetical protein ABI947_07545 [Chloroflexota bacterium]